MNLPNKITMGRIGMAIIVLILLIFPFYQVGVEFPTYLIADTVKLDLRYIIAGIIVGLMRGFITEIIFVFLSKRRNIQTKTA